MNREQLFQQIDNLNEEYLQLWEDITAIESPSEYKTGVDAVGRYMVERARKKGWKTEVCHQPVSGDAVCITLNPDVPALPVALSGHMDTVHPVGTFGTPTVRRDAEKIYGPGVLDCKSGVAVGFLILDALDRCGYRERPVMLLLQSDEEIGSRTSNKETIGWICEKAKNAVAFFNLENSADGFAVVSRRGIARFDFTVTGKSTHSANCDVGASAITQAAHMIIELEKFKDKETVTCNCGVISGGTTPNTVPGQCNFVADIRYTTDADLENARKKIAEVANTVYVPGCSCTYKLLSYRVGMPILQRNLDLLDKINAIFTEEGMPTLAPKQRYSGSDAADVTAAGIPCLDSMGPSGGGVHSKNEFAWLKSLSEAAKRVALVVSRI